MPGSVKAGVFWRLVVCWRVARERPLRCHHMMQASCCWSTSCPHHAGMPQHRAPCISYLLSVGCEPWDPFLSLPVPVNKGAICQRRQAAASCAVQYSGVHSLDMHSGQHEEQLQQRPGQSMQQAGDSLWRDASSMACMEAYQASSSASD